MALLVQKAWGAVEISLLSCVEAEIYKYFLLEAAILDLLLLSIIYTVDEYKKNYFRSFLSIINRLGVIRNPKTTLKSCKSHHYCQR
jgi:hypothetical protein